MIDLELVKLRAKLRGWPVLPGEGEVCVETPHGDVWVRSEPWPGSADAVYERGAARFAPMLTAPRWTLKRLLSEPPEGWTGMALENGYVAGVMAFGWDPKTDNRGVTAVVYRNGKRYGYRFNVEHTDELACYAERLKAAAELALILAEVEL